MDVSQITSLASGLDNLDLKSQVNTVVMKKALDNQQSSATAFSNQFHNC